MKTSSHTLKKNELGCLWNIWSLFCSIRLSTEEKKKGLVRFDIKTNKSRIPRPWPPKQFPWKYTQIPLHPLWLAAGKIHGRNPGVTQNYIKIMLCSYFHVTHFPRLKIKTARHRVSNLPPLLLFKLAEPTNNNHGRIHSHANSLPALHILPVICTGVAVWTVAVLYSFAGLIMPSADACPSVSQ